MIYPEDVEFVLCSIGRVQRDPKGLGPSDDTLEKPHPSTLLLVIPLLEDSRKRGGCSDEDRVV